MWRWRSEKTNVSRTSEQAELYLMPCEMVATTYKNKKLEYGILVGCPNALSYHMWSSPTHLKHPINHTRLKESRAKAKEEAMQE